jgi:lipoate-protein ligase A
MTEMDERKHSTSNIQHPTSKARGERERTSDVECSVLDVGCSRSSTWLVLESGPGAAAFNIALDEALLEAMPRLHKPVLRFYGWTEHAATFGYFQKHSEVERATPMRPLIRRPTGGGIVPHDADWTYSLAFPENHEWYSLRAAESYGRVHEWLQSAFTRLNIATDLAPSRRKAAPGQCFAGHEPSDLLWNGRKIAGAAQRRTRDGLLIQGSVQPPPASPSSDGVSAKEIANLGPWRFSRADWQAAMLDTAQSVWRVAWTELKLDKELAVAAANLSAGKYSQERYNRKR